MILDLGWALNSIPDSPIRRGKATESQKSNVMTEAELEVIYLQANAKGCQQSPGSYPQA